jgi:uncharacterized protein with PQ loop repeat
MNEKLVDRLGWFASIMAVAMYASYIDQIRLNLSGQAGSIVLPIMTTINCCAWVSYGYLKTKVDWPIIVCNAFGIITGLLTVITAW